MAGKPQYLHAGRGSNDPTSQNRMCRANSAVKIRYLSLEEDPESILTWSGPQVVEIVPNT